MTDVELRIDARWVLPIEPAGLLHQHSLLVREGRIVAVAPTALAERDYAAREHVALATHVLLPGLVNAHTHAAMSLLRGVADDLPLKAWLEQSIWPREGRFVEDAAAAVQFLLAYRLHHIICRRNQRGAADFTPAHSDLDQIVA